ncbi:unnamed protein product [Polarella glacialis]|uniref:Uncharacterized protein n=1 Tax=Polarella glacialis TaxID=89957 RepID=A0A813DNW6_POLGL|nr:unnamed protein product [Polarella glacialis]
MASSDDDGMLLDITLFDMSGKEIIRGTWHGHCKAHELFQAAHKSKPGFRCKLLHGSEELSPQSDLASLLQNVVHLTVVWMRGDAQSKLLAIHHAFAAIKSDGSVITWGHSGKGGDSSRVAYRLQEGVL